MYFIRYILCYVYYNLYICNMKTVKVTMLELSHRSNCWMVEFAIYVHNGNHRPQIVFAEYPDWDFLYGKYRIYQFNFN